MLSAWSLLLANDAECVQVLLGYASPFIFISIVLRMEAEFHPCAVFFVGIVFVCAHVGSIILCVSP